MNALIKKFAGVVKGVLTGFWEKYQTWYPPIQSTLLRREREEGTDPDPPRAKERRP